jgi:hypothetical protein
VKDLSATAEFDQLDLGDARREARVLRVVEALQRNPAASFPSTMESVAEREAFYRLVNNEAVTLQDLIASHTAQTLGRMLACAERPIVAIDKTKFIFTGEGEREGLERISQNKQSFEAMVALAITTSRQTHGVLAAIDLESSGKSRPEHWDAFIDDACRDAEAAGLQPIVVIDREADIYELFHLLAQRNRDFVIRVSWDRVAREFGEETDEKMRAIVQRAGVMLSRTVQLSRRVDGDRTSGNKRNHPARSARDAQLVVRAACVSITRPALKKLIALPPRLTLQVVLVSEQNAPADMQPIDWLLVTSLPINDTTSVEAIVDAYRRRWPIEEFFKALKSGCSYESRQLESRHALLNALGLLIPIAWRLLELRTIAEEDPSAPATVILEPDEIHVLTKLSKDVKLSKTPTVSEAMLAIAALGGHIRQNGRPGWQVLHRGFDKMRTRLEGYRLAVAEM